MPQIYFNDCFLGEFGKEPATDCLVDTLIEYQDVLTSYPDDIEGIVTAKAISEQTLNGGEYSLEELICEIPSKDLRNFGYKLFTKYPIASFFEISDEDDLISKEYYVTVAGRSHSAINHVIVSRNEGVLFSLGLHRDLRIHTMNILSNGESTISVTNLFGHPGNTRFVKEQIEQSRVQKLGNFDRLLSILGENVFSERFKKSFDGQSSAVQLAVIEHFEQAIGRNGDTSLFADGQLIKDVGPVKAKYGLFELRLFDPVAIRVYFFETNEKVYLALLEPKPQPKKQSNDIKAAYSIIEQMKIMGR